MAVAAGKPCPVCHTLLSMNTIDEAAGEEGPMRITLRNMPALFCTGQHRYFAQPDFPLWLMTHLRDEDEAKLPAALAKGFLIKHYMCSTCGKEIEPKPDHRHTFDIRLVYPGTSEFGVELSMPVYKCTGCAREQLHSLDEVRKLTPAALVQAFKAAALKAPD